MGSRKRAALRNRNLPIVGPRTTPSRRDFWSRRCAPSLARARGWKLAWDDAISLLLGADKAVHHQFSARLVEIDGQLGAIHGDYGAGAKFAVNHARSLVEGQRSRAAALERVFENGARRPTHSSARLHRNRGSALPRGASLACRSAKQIRFRGRRTAMTHSRHDHPPIRQNRRTLYGRRAIPG